MNPNCKIKQELKHRLHFTENKDLDKLQSNNTPVSKTILDKESTPENITPTISSTEINTNSKLYTNTHTPLSFYHYPIDFLDKDIDNIDYSDITRVNVCVFTVNTDGMQPFLLYLLNKHDDTMVWPHFTPKYNIDIETRSKLTDLDIEEQSEFKGYINQNDVVYMFYQIQDNFEHRMLCKKNEPFWWTSIYEILFSRTLLYFVISPYVYELFVEEPRLQYLLNKENLPYETPLIAYNGSNDNELEYSLRVGLFKGNPASASQGPFYYFANYMRAAKFGAYNVLGGYSEKEIGGEIITDNEYGRYIKGGIIRYIIFPGKQKVMFNRPWDKNNANNENIPPYKKKLYNTEGNWTTDYDSVVLGPVEIVPGKLIHNGTSFTLINFYQYKALTCHYLDKSSVPEQYLPELDEQFWKVNYEQPHFKIA